MENYPLQGYLTCLAKLKKTPELQAGRFILLDGDSSIQAVWVGDSNRILYGIFNVKGISDRIDVQLPDGIYEDVLNNCTVEVTGQSIEAPWGAVILRVEVPVALRKYSCKAIDYRVLP